MPIIHTQFELEVEVRIRFMYLSYLNISHTIALLNNGEIIQFDMIKFLGYKPIYTIIKKHETIQQSQSFCYKFHKPRSDLASPAR